MTSWKRFVVSIWQYCAYGIEFYALVSYNHREAEQYIIQISNFLLCGTYIGSKGDIQGSAASSTSPAAENASGNFVPVMKPEELEKGEIKDMFILQHYALEEYLVSQVLKYRQPLLVEKIIKHKAK